MLEKPIIERDIDTLESDVNSINIALATKVDKIAGKDLSANDFTDVYKTKLDGIATGANNYVHPDTHAATMITQDSTHRFATDTEKANWNDANSKKHVQNTDNTLTTSTSNTINTTSVTANIVDFKVNNTTKTSIDSNGNFTGNAATASSAMKLQAAKTISVNGSVLGSASFDGSDNIIITTTTNHDHNTSYYTKSYVDGQLNTKSNTTHNHTLASLSERSYDSLTNTPILGTAASKNTGTASGQIPIIGVDGKIDSGVLPALAVNDTFVCGTEAEMLALTAQIGDICVRTDLRKSFILKLTDATVLTSWQELLTPTDVVQSVAGKTGTVVLSKSDVGLANVDNVKQATKTEFDTHATNTTVHITSTERTTWNAVTNKVDKVTGKDLSANDFTDAYKLKLDGIATGANSYTHPTGDGNLHVPATGTTNSGKVLKAGATAGSISWGTLTYSDVGAAASGHNHDTTYLGITANAASASKLATARTISLTGDVTGSTTFDGSGNASITATVADDSHNHIISNVDGLQTALDGKSATSHNHDAAYLGITAKAADSAKLNGQDASYYVNYNNFTNTPTFSQHVINVTVNATTTFTIPAIGFNSTTDTLLVLYNNLLLYKDINYSFSADFTQILIDGYSLNSGEKLVLMLMKNVKMM